MYSNRAISDECASDEEVWEGENKEEGTHCKSHTQTRTTSKEGHSGRSYKSAGLNLCYTRPARRLYMVSLVSQNVLIKKSDRDFVLSKLTWHVLYLIKIAPSILLHMVIACGTWAHTAGKHNTTAAS